MDYNVKDLSNKTYDIFGVTISDGKSFMFYKQKGEVINNVFICLDKDMNVSPGQVVLTLKNIKDVDGIKEVIKIFIKVSYMYAKLDVRSLIYNLYCNDKGEEDLFVSIFEKSKFEYSIVKSEKYIFECKKIEEEKKKKEEERKRKEEEKKRIEEEEKREEVKEDLFLINKDLSNTQQIYEDFEEIYNKTKTVDDIYYLDGNNIMNKRGKKIGNLGVDGYKIDIENNYLVCNGENIGIIDDISNIDKDFEDLLDKKHNIHVPFILIGIAVIILFISIIIWIIS